MGRKSGAIKRITGTNASAAGDQIRRERTSRIRLTPKRKRKRRRVRRSRRLAPWPSTRTKVGGTRASFIGIPQFQRRKRRRRRRRWSLRRRLRWRRRRRKRKRSRKRKRKKKTIGSTSAEDGAEWFRR